MPQSGRGSIRAVALGTVVRVRRLAEAIRVLGPQYDFEARLQVRTILELYFNYAWMRLTHPHSRATRFLRFQTIEKLRLAKTLAPHSPAHARELPAHIARLRRRRTSLRHLFRSTNKQGKRRWAHDWAGGLSFEGRVNEVVTASSALGETGDRFFYGLYRWLSGAAHGSAQSFHDVLVLDAGRVRAKSNEELASEKCQEAATACLLAVWSLAARDLRLPHEIRIDIDRRLRDLVRTLEIERDGEQG
jgi:hypothetical protein